MTSFSIKIFTQKDILNGTPNPIERTCKSWSGTKFSPIDGTGHSFCRNPDGKKGGPYCVVARGKIGFCDVPKCPNFDQFNDEDSLFDQIMNGAVDIGGMVHQTAGNLGSRLGDVLSGFNTKVTWLIGKESYFRLPKLFIQPVMWRMRSHWTT